MNVAAWLIPGGTPFGQLQRKLWSDVPEPRARLALVTKKSKVVWNGLLRYTLVPLKCTSKVSTPFEGTFEGRSENL